MNLETKRGRKGKGANRGWDWTTVREIISYMDNLLRYLAAVAGYSVITPSMPAPTA